MTAEIEACARWLEQQLSETPFGDAAVKITIHRGLISRVEQTRTVKLKTEPDNGTHHEHGRR